MGTSLAARPDVRHYQHRVVCAMATKTGKTVSASAPFTVS